MGKKFSNILDEGCDIDFIFLLEENATLFFKHHN